ncbi:MAG: hypothetical protein IID52_03820 [Proteobacteria bacterium]|nr:hypothetical protein [Pseudomonadota bacterium]
MADKTRFSPVEKKGRDHFFTVQLAGNPFLILKKRASPKAMAKIFGQKTPSHPQPAPSSHKKTR